MDMRHRSTPGPTCQRYALRRHRVNSHTLVTQPRQITRGQPTQARPSSGVCSTIGIPSGVRPSTLTQVKGELIYRHARRWGISTPQPVDNC